jgi:hypothetical protein
VLPQQFARSSIHSVFIEQAVFGIDRWLRYRQGVSEYTDNRQCLFRIQPAKEEREVVLSDGTHLTAGALVLNLHLWNEHVPPMGPNGATMQWARALAQGIDLSLRELALHLRWTRSLDDVVALRADMRLGTAGQGAQLARIAARYGFEPACSSLDDLGPMHRLAENVFIMLLVLATNPVALRSPVLRRDRTLVYLSRLALERRYAVTASRRGKRGATLC